MDATSDACRPNKRARASDAIWLHCPICLEVPDSPIQCRNGHVICAGCSSPSLTSCPTCRVALDPSNPIQCLVAKQLIEKDEHEEDSDLVVCRGGCGWTGRPGDDGALAIHEGGCVAATRSLVAVLERRHDDMQSQLERQAELIDSLTSKLGALAEQRSTLSSVGVGCRAAAWRACVEAYKANPLSGAEIFVSHQEPKEGALRIYCIVPGISHLAGGRLGFYARYNPETHRAFNVARVFKSSTTSSGCRLRLGPAIALGHPETALSLRELLVAMQCSAVMRPTSVTADENNTTEAKKRQQLARCELFDNPPPVSFGPSFTTLEKSLIRMDQRVSEQWVETEWDGVKIVHPKLPGVAEQNLMATAGTAPPTKRIKFENVPFRSKERDIAGLLQSAGFLNTTVEKPKFTFVGGRKTYKVSTAYASMKDSVDALNACYQLNGKVLMGRHLTVSLD